MSDPLKAESLDLSSLRIRRDEDLPSSGRPGLWIALLIVLLAGVGGAYLILKKGSRLPVVQVDLVRRVGAGATGALLSAGGYILPDRKADVSSRVFGRLEWIGVEAGSKVKANDIIARLSNAVETARLEEAKASLADAEREFARTKGLVEDGIQPRQELDRAQATLDIARARFKTAEADLEYTLIRAPFDGVIVRRNAQ